MLSFRQAAARLRKTRWYVSSSEWTLRNWASIYQSEIACRMVRGAFWSLMGTVASRGLMLSALVIVARMVGKEQFGELGIVRSTIASLGALAGVGLGITATKHIADFRQTDPERAGRIVTLAERMSLSAAAAVSLVLFLCSPWIASRLLNAPHLAGLLGIGCLLLVLEVLKGIQIGTLAGLEAFKPMAVVTLFGSIGAFPVLLAGAYWGGIHGVVWGLVASALLQCVLNRIVIGRELHRARIPLGPSGWVQEWPVLWHFSLPAVISATMVGPVNWACITMLANQPGGYAELGVFEAAGQWRTLVSYVSTIVMGSSLPVLSQLYSEGRKRQFKKALFSQFLFNTTLTIVLAAVIALLAGRVVGLYGSDFEDAANVLQLMMLTSCVMVAAQVAGMVNKSTGTLWYGVSLNMIWAIVVILSSYWLVSRGAMGLTVAQLIAYATHLISTMVYISYLLHRSPALNSATVAAKE